MQFERKTRAGNINTIIKLLIKIVLVLLFLVIVFILIDRIDFPSPIKIIAPGKVYRCDADVSHSPVFHQIEGLYVDKTVTLAHLKGTLTTFLQSFFGKSYDVRFRASYFPFTEPSVEIDVKWNDPDSPLHGKWFEVMGAGLVHRNVFRQSNIDPDHYTGFAFGMGVERLAMLKYQINDIRLLYDNDSRLLKQF